MGSEETQTSKTEKTGLKDIWTSVLGFFRHTSTTSAQLSSTSTSTSLPAEPSAARAPESRPESNSEPTTVQPAIIEVDDTTFASPVTLDPATHALLNQPSPPPPDPRDEAPMQLGKAQAIFAKYNLEFNEADWGTRPRQPYERVTKNIRMRVRYTCHYCSATFGHDRNCLGCQHRRCSQCVRYPPKKNRPRERRPEQSSSQNSTAPTGTSGRWACHECHVGFESGIQECPNCHHQICDRCLQEATITLDQPPDQPVDDLVDAPMAEERTTTTS